MRADERRKHIDAVVLITRIMSVLSWVLFLVSLILFHYARPELEYGIIRYFDIPVRDYWLMKPKNLVSLMLIVSTCLSCSVLFLKRNRTKRASDSHGFNQISVLCICLFFVVVINI